MEVIACFSIKGGVGKTAAAVNLAAAASEMKHRVLVWDLDPQSAAGFYLGVDLPEKGIAKGILKKSVDLVDAIVETHFDDIDLIAADRSARRLEGLLEHEAHPERVLAKRLQSVADDYDVIILDCPPTQSRLAESILGAATGIVVPVIPTPLSARTLEQLRQLRQKTESRAVLLPFLSMVDRRKAIHRDLSTTLRAEHGDFLMTTIPYAATVERMGTERKPLAHFAPKSLPCVAYRGLWLEIQERLASERAVLNVSNH